MPACNISCQKPAFRKDEKRGQKWTRNSSPFLEPSSIGTITEGSENGPISGPAFWCRRTTPELVLGVANLGTDREMPSNATSSSGLLYICAPCALGAGLEKIACFHRCLDAQENYFYETQWKMSTEKMQGKWFQEPNAANVCHVPHGDKFMSLSYLNILWKQACKLQLHTTPKLLKT